MKIKNKILLLTGTILLISGILLNITIRSVLNNRFEYTISESLSQIKASSYETIKYRISLDSSSLTTNLSNESEYITNYLLINNNCKSIIKNDKNEILSNEFTKSFNDEINSLTSKSKNGTTLIHIKYVDSTCYGFLSYPISIDNTIIGTLTLSKNFESLYKENIKVLTLLTLIEIITFIIIFICIIFIISNITKPITELTKASKEMELGNYNFVISSKRKDELGILSREFESMKNKIQLQIDTINTEKNKVLALEQHRRTFFNNVTHELKTPLTAIIGYAEMLKNNIVDDEDFKSRALDRIYSESERAHQLVLDLINVSKGQSEHSEEFVKTNIDKLLEDVISDLKIKASKYSLNLNYSIDECELLCQPNKIKQVLINVIDNAIKYTINSNKIDIIAKNDDNKYIVYIKNTSNPIPNDIFDSIFEPFVKGTNPKEEYSSGLGLYISKQIMEMNNGSISITNGSLIIVELVFNKISSTC